MLPEHAATQPHDGDDQAGTPEPALWFGPGDERFEAAAALVREHRGRSGLPDLRVRAGDDMYKWGLLTCDTEAVGTMAYFRSGLVLADTVRLVCSQWFGADGPKRLLDFACGYGRALRYAVDELGADRVTGCEILPDAVDFVGAALGATGLTSSTDPHDLGLHDQYDLVVVSSLFTHLPEATFVPWLARLYDLVAPGGLLLVTVHDETHLPDGEHMPESGLWFQATTEVESLDAQEYGGTVVSVPFMAAAVDQACGHRPYRRFPKAWCFEQDVYVVPHDDDADLSRLSLPRGAQGCVDSVVAPAGDTLALAGWAATQDGGVRVTDVEARLDGRLLGRVAPAVERPDVQAFLGAPGQHDCLRSGWRLREPMVGASPDSVLTVVAHTSDGRHAAIWGMRLGDCLDRERSVPLWGDRPAEAPEPPPAQPPAAGDERSFRDSVRGAYAAGGPAAAAREAGTVASRRAWAAYRAARGGA